ncbi:MAG: acetate uptake transporter [Acetobacterium sp.]|nr:acetate uptake transporter [Acetobacterium sp.]
MSDNVSKIDKIADPTTMGIASFAVGLFVLAFMVAGMIPADAVGIIIPLAIAVSVVHFFAGAFGYVKGELYTALAFNIYGMFWLFFGLLNFGIVMGWFAPDAASMGILYLAWTIFTLIVFIATLRTATAVILCIGTLLAVFGLLTLSMFLASPALGIFAGYIGIFTSLCAFYICAAGIINTMYDRTLLPMGSAWLK